MAIKLYYNINTFQYIGKVTGGETWVQGDDDSKELELYFGTGDLLTFVNGLTNVTVFDKNCRVSFTRPDDETATIGASQITSGSAGYYKIVIDSWVTNAEGTVELDTQRYVTDTSITAYGQATITVAEGTPSPDEGYALKTELNAVEAKADANTTNKHNKSAIVTTTAEGDPTIDTEVNSTAKTAELLASNSSTDQAYTDTVTDDILDGTTAFTAVNLGTDGTTGVIDYDGTCRVLEVNLGNGVVQQIGEENFICATNKSGSQVTTPTVCEITGSTGNKLQFEVASNDGTPTGNIALATETIANNASGKLTHFGLIRGVNTTEIAGSPIEGAVIYLGTNGGLTTVKPEAPNAIIRIGNIVTANASVGVIFVDIQRSGKFANQSDVYFNGGLSDGDLPQYVAANTRWEAINKADITVGKATADASGNVITTTYATKTELETAVTGLYDYKGTVATYADLPSSGQEVGDVYNVLNDENTGDTGVNYAWDGSAWDNIGGSAVTKVDKDLSGYTPVTASAVADNDNARVYLDNDGAERSMTLTEIYAGANTATGAFVASATYSDLTSGDSIMVLIHDAQLDSGGDYKVDLKTVTRDKLVFIKFPTVNSTDDLRFSTDNGVTYYNVTKNGSTFKASLVSNQLVRLEFNGTNFIADIQSDVEIEETYTDRIESTYGEFNPLDKGLPIVKEIQGRTIPALENLVTNGDTFSSGFVLSNATGSVTGGIYSITATSQYGRLVHAETYVNGNVYLSIARIKVFSTGVGLGSYSGTSMTYHTGSGNYEILKHSIIAPSTSGAVTIQDIKISDWTQIDVDYVQLFNLTASHGVTETSGEAYDNAVADIEAQLEANGGYISTTPTTHVENTEIKSVGKNLFDGVFTSQTVGLKFTRLSATQFKIERTGDTGIDTVNLFPNIKFLPATQYTFSGNHYEVDDSRNLRFNIIYTDGTNTVFGFPNTVDTSYSVTSTAGKTISLITYTYSSAGGITIYSNFQLELGTVETTYEPYNTETQKFNHGALRSTIDKTVYDKIRYENGAYVKDVYIDESDNTALATPLLATEVIDVDGTLIQESTTTVEQLQNIPTTYKLEYSMNTEQTIKTLVERDKLQQKEIDEIEEDVANKVDKDGDKVLSDNNYTDAEKTKVGYVTVTESVDLDDVKEETVILSTSTDVSNATTKPGTSNVTLSSSTANFSRVKIFYSYANDKHASIELEVGDLTNVNILTIPIGRSSNLSQEASFFLQADSGTAWTAWGGREVSLTFTPVGVTTAVLSSIDIEKVIGIK